MKHVKEEKGRERSRIKSNKHRSISKGSFHSERLSTARGDARRVGRWQRTREKKG